MGLLDGILGNTWDDPKTAATFGMAQGLLSSQHAVQGLVSGMGDYGATLQAQKDREMQRRMQQLQMNQLVQKQSLIAPLIASLNGPGAFQQPDQSAQPAQPDAGQQPIGSAIGSMPQQQFNPAAQAAAARLQAAPPAQRLTMLRQMTPDHVAALKLGAGIDLLPEWKAATEGSERKPGYYYDIPGVGREYVPDPTKGVTLGPNGQVQVMPGAAATQSTLASANASANEGAKAALDLVDYVNPTDGQPYKMTRQQMASMAGGGGAQGGISPKVAASMTNDAQSGPVLFNIGGQRGVMNQGDSMLPQQSPNGPGLASGQTPAQLTAQAAGKEAATTVAKNAAEYENNLNDKVVAGRELVRIVNQQEPLLNQFQTGASGPVRAKAAAWVRDMGGPSGLVTMIANGDPTAAQEFTKFSAQMNLAQIKQIIGSNRLLKTEFQAVQDVNPNIASDPNAIRAVFNWVRQTYGRDYGEQQALAQYKQQGGDLSQFPAYYSQQQHQGLMDASAASTKKPVATGMLNGRKVLKFDDGSVDYAN